MFEVEKPTLLHSDLLLDLYGDELNSRTYIFNDPVKGNLMLRPDFTVPIVQLHIKTNTKNAKVSMVISHVREYSSVTLNKAVKKMPTKNVWINKISSILTN